MDIKTLGKALLFPHIAIAIILIPIAVVMLVYSMVFIGSESITAYISYAISAYTLMIWCIKIPYLVRFFKNIKNENKYAVRWLNDAQLRVSVSLYGSFIWNVAFAIFQLWLGLYHSSFWFYSMAGYYLSLAIMRFFLVRYTTKNKPGEHMLPELIRYRTCGWIFLVMNMALSIMIFFMVYWNRTFTHHEITTIAMAAYTFTSFTFAIVNIFKYKKYNSPVYSASKAISFTAACVSMLTLESTMLTTFGDGTMDMLERKILLGVSGGTISAFIITMAIYMIVKSTNKIRLIKTGESING